MEEIKYINRDDRNVGYINIPRNTDTKQVGIDKHNNNKEEGIEDIGQSKFSERYTYQPEILSKNEINKMMNEVKEVNEVKEIVPNNTDTLFLFVNPKSGSEEGKKYILEVAGKENKSDNDLVIKITVDDNKENDKKINAYLIDITNMNSMKWGVNLLQSELYNSKLVYKII